MSKSSLIKRLTDTPEKMRLYQQERASLELTELICEIMEKQGMTRAELASYLHITEYWVSCFLDARVSMSVVMASDIFTALGHSLHFHTGPLDV